MKFSQPLGLISDAAEVMDRANRLLNKSQETVTQIDLQNAFRDFSRVLDAKRQQNPAPTAKELARLYQKLMSTSVQLSHGLKLKPTERIAHMKDAENFAKLALQEAERSGNNDRLAQMRFYLAYVKGREVSLRIAAQQREQPDRALVAEQDSALEAVGLALATLRSISNLDMTVYDAMAKEFMTTA